MSLKQIETNFTPLKTFKIKNQVIELAKESSGDRLCRLTVYTVSPLDHKTLDHLEFMTFDKCVAQFGHYVTLAELVE